MLKMNSKGQTPTLIFTILAVVVVVILTIAFLSSNNIRAIIIGSTLIFATLYLILTKESSSEKAMNVAAIVIIAGILIVLLGTLKLVPQIAFSPTFTPVYCNQYEFTCCNEKEYTSTNPTLSYTSAWQCPSYATRCIVTSAQNEFFSGTADCGLKFSAIALRNVYSCSDQKTVNTGIEIKPNQYIYESFVSSSNNVQIKVYTDQLDFCGRSGCTTGTRISSSNCVLTESQGTIYSAVGNNLGVKSTTVPRGQCVLSWHSGDRTICGNLEEKCTQDSDCAGHTYGNKECTGRTLQTYGCNDLSLPSGVSLINGQYVGANILPGITTPAYSGQLSRCEIVSATPVECCGDTDCGTNMFCDKTSFTCKAKVQCTRNSDCGVSQQCDYATKTLKTPSCSSGQCTYSTQAVDCCYDTNCPSGYTCSSSKTCEKMVEVKTACPNDCCVGDSNYVDKPCTSGMFCIDNKCTAEGCTSDSDCLSTETCSSGNCISKENGKTDCEAKAASNPFFGYTWIEEKTSQCGFLCNIGISAPTTVNTSYCKATYVTYYIIIGTVAILGIAIYFLLRKPRRKR